MSPRFSPNKICLSTLLAGDWFPRRGEYLNKYPGWNLPLETIYNLSEFNFRSFSSRIDFCCLHYYIIPFVKFYVYSLNFFFFYFEKSFVTGLYKLSAIVSQQNTFGTWKKSMKKGITQESKLMLSILERKGWNL